MATFIEAFPGGNGAAWPAAWTTSTFGGAGGTIDVQSASGRMLTAATTSHTTRAILASGSWNQADCEIYTFLQLQTGLGQAGLILRGSGTWSGAESDCPVNGYRLLVDTSGGQFGFFKTVASTTTQVGSWQPFTFTVGVIYAVRFRVQGTALKAKIWNSVSGEPTPWTYEQTDSSITAAGQLQLAYRTTGADARDARWVGLAVTTDIFTGTVARTLGTVTSFTSGGTAGSLGTPMLNAPFARNVWDLHVFAGKVFVGYGDTTGNQGPITIYAFDPNTQTFTAEYVAPSEELGLFRILNGTIHAMDFDQRGGGAGFYRRDAGVWTRHETIAALHTYDMVEFGGAFFVGVSASAANTNIQRSTDFGETWVDVDDPVTTYWGRCHSLFVVNGVLYATQEGASEGVVIYQWTGSSPFVTTGKTLETIMPSSGAIDPDWLRMPRFVEFAGKFVYAAADLVGSHWEALALYRCDAGLTNPVKITSVPAPYDILVRGSTVYACTWDGANVGVWRSTDAVTWTQYFSFASGTFARSFEELNGVWYFGLGTTAAANNQLSGQILTYTPATVGAGLALNANNSTLAYATDPAVTAGQFAFDFVDGSVGLFLSSVDSNVAGTLAVTLGAVTSAASGAGATGTLARTLANATIAASGGSSNGGTLARTLDPVVVQAAGGQGNAGTLARTLGNTTVVASGAFGGGTGATGTLARTLDAVETAAALTDEFGDPIVDNTGLPILDESGNPVLDESGLPLLDTTGFPILVRGAEGSVGLGSGNLAVTLANLTCAASGTAGGAAGTVARTLANVTSAASGASGATGTVARTLGAVTSTASGSHSVPGSLAVTLGNLTSTATGAVTTAGSVARTLGNVTSAATGTSTPSGVAGNLGVNLANTTSATSGASGAGGTLAELLDAVIAAAGGSSTHGAITETLDDLTTAASGTAGLAPVTGSANIVLANLTAQANGSPGTTGTVNRTLAELVADSVGSTVSGTVARTLANITSTTVGTGSHVDFQSVTLRERGFCVTLREMN